jgi:hypothetical protein
MNLPENASISQSMSQTIGKLATALCEAQKEMGAIPKDSNNPFFKSKYSDLATVSQHIIPIITKHGLSISQTHSPIDSCGSVTEEFSTKDGRHVTIVTPYPLVVIHTLLMHTSGEWISSTLVIPPAKNDPQGIGSAITYGRRYSFMSIVGAVSDEDDDGNRGSGLTEKSQPQRKPKEPEPKKPSGATKEAKVKKLHAIFTNMKAGDKNYRNFLKLYGVESSKDMDDVTLNKALVHAEVLQDFLKKMISAGYDVKGISKFTKEFAGVANPFQMTSENILTCTKKFREIEEGLDAEQVDMFADDIDDMNDIK